jgi:hypothetical protein
LLSGLVVVASSASVALAEPPPFVEDGETVYIELDDRFIGDLGTDGGVVYANFNGVEGTLAGINARVGSMYVSIALMDGSGTEIDLGDTLTEGWQRATVTDFEIPASGNYTFVIMGEPDAPFAPGVGSSGQALLLPPGRLHAKTSGDVPDWVVFGTLAGTVTNTLTGVAIPGVGVYVGPFLLVTDGAGDYEGDLPADSYAVSFEATYFHPYDTSIVLFPLVPTTLDAVLDPVAPVVVNVIVTGDPIPGNTIEAMAEVIILDGSTLGGYAWTQTAGVPVIIDGADTDTALVELGAAGEYKARLFEILAEPPIDPDELPPNVPPPEGEFHGGLQDRFQVAGVNPFSLEEACHIALEVEVITTSGSHFGEADFETHSPWDVSLGVHTVPIGVPVLLHGKVQKTYDWSMTVPDGSGAMLIDEMEQNPEFTPDVPGLYSLTVTEQGVGPLVLDVYAGNYRGVIVGQDDDGRPISDTSCTGCHSGFAPDKFTPWAQTGHAEIFTYNLNNSSYYNPGCFACHTVGYYPDAANSGFDDAADYHDFLDGGLIGNPGDNWTTMLDLYPEAARLANIQCENCHGPQDAEPGVFIDAHEEGAPRVDISSNVCGSCHGEPLRHGRFQQWQLSGHANYELAIDEHDSGNCSRCHTGNGFLTWLPILLGDEPGDPFEDIVVTWGPDEAHAQTCVTCHDPHAIGTTSGNDTNATVRISGNTPPLIAGFTAYGVGRGAVCMTCHNSRRGLRNDDTFADHYQTSEAARAPHGSAQTDVIMGQNAYFVDVGIRGGHSFVTDVCVSCHMVETPPPDDLSYEQGGTNHTFYAAIEVCAECHGDAVDGEFVQDGIHDTLDVLQGLVEEALLALIDQLTGVANEYVLNLDDEVEITDVSEVEELIFGEARGRQAMTVVIGGVTYGPYRMNDIAVIDPSIPEVLGEFYDFADPALIKAGWNYNLVHNDGSMGVHNPTYSYLVLVAGIEAVDPLAAAALDVPWWMEPGWRSRMRMPPIEN